MSEPTISAPVAGHARLFEALESRLGNWTFADGESVDDLADRMVAAIPGVATDGQTVPSLKDVLRTLATGVNDPWTWAQWLAAPDTRAVRHIDRLWAGLDAEVLYHARQAAAQWALRPSEPHASRHYAQVTSEEPQASRGSG